LRADSLKSGAVSPTASLSTCLWRQRLTDSTRCTTCDRYREQCRDWVVRASALVAPLHFDQARRRPQQSVGVPRPVADRCFAVPRGGASLNTSAHQHRSLSDCSFRYGVALKSCCSRHRRRAAARSRGSAVNRVCEKSGTNRAIVAAMPARLSWERRVGHALSRHLAPRPYRTCTVTSTA